MLDTLQKIEKLHGNVAVAGESIGDCSYEFSYNPYETNSMFVVLYNLKEGIPQGRNAPQVTITTKFSWGMYQLILNAKLTSFKLTGKGSEYKLPVLEFKQEEYFDKDKLAKKVSVGYKFPITSITDCSGSAIRHSEYGYFRGSYDRENNIFSPGDKFFEVESKVGKVTVGDEFDFHQSADKLYPQIHLVRRSFIGISKLIENNTTIEENLDEINDSAERLFDSISLIERNRINWHTQSYFCSTAQGKPISPI